MPNMDRTGPIGQGPGVSAGRGRGRGLGRMANPNRKHNGGSDDCVCPKCGYTVAHTRGTPCSTLKCPKCNVPLRGRNCR